MCLFSYDVIGVHVHVHPPPDQHDGVSLCKDQLQSSSAAKARDVETSDSLQDFAGMLEETGGALPELHNTARSFTTQMSGWLVGVAATIRTQEGRNIAGFQQLVPVAVCARTFLVNVENFFWHGQHEGRVKQAKAGIRQDEPDYAPLHDYIDQLQRNLAQARESGEKFSTACKDAIEGFRKQAVVYKEKAREERDKVIKTRIAGGTVAGAVIATGVGTGITLSVVAGVFTFGVGTIVGLSLTAAGTAAAGVALGATASTATHFVGHHFEEKEEILNRCSEQLTRLQQINEQIGLNVSHICKRLDKLVSHINVCKTVEALCLALDRLLQRFDEFYNKISSYRQDLEDKEEILRNALEVE